MNRTLVETMRSMLADSELPKRFWTKALSTATYLRNRSPTNAVQDKTPYEAWAGNEPNVFLGYGQGVKGCRLYDKAQKRMFYSRNVVFNETRSTKQDGVKGVTEDEPSAELEMECQSEDDNTTNHCADEESQ